MKRSPPEPAPSLEETFRRRLLADLAELERQVEYLEPEIDLEPIDAAAAIAELRSTIDATAASLAGEVRAWAEILAPSRSAAMLARPRLADAWRLPWAVSGYVEFGASPLERFPVSGLQPPDVTRPRPWLVWDACERSRLHLAGCPFGGEAWPASATAATVAAWLGEAIGKNRPELGKLGEKILDAGRTRGALLSVPRLAPALVHLEPHNAALLFDVHAEIAEGKKRRTFPIDAGTPHRALLAGMASMPKHPTHLMEVSKFGTRLELFSPDDRRPVQLELEMDDTPQSALVQAIREFRSFEGLRAWGTLLRLFGHDGRADWFLDAHLEAMGLEPKQRTPRRRAEIAALVGFISRLELRSTDGDSRIRGRLFATFEREKRTSAGNWLLDTMRIHINPALFDGVRRPDGMLGNNFWPVPAELSTLNTRDYGHAHALGLQLPIHWRLWTGERRHKGLAEDAPLVRSGAKLLRLAGMPGPRARQAGGEARTWARLERNLDKLQEIGLLGSWHWRDGAPSLAGMVELNAAPWALDRVIRGVEPERYLGGIGAPTGAELRRWREATDRTQAALASTLGVSLRTLVTIEGRAKERVKPELAAKLRDLGMTVPELDRDNT